ncbi:hypothetical protein DUI87_29199 [Hirundo rustica rustica]|uniref:Uncharacterized protein n=1 Tax=Hirundo rustica rustica TaxID=333673 RepID=A0A3M0J6I7_HIRRU|nr:hypothetical protein DUI87_29199 [Hirundo rustica rustica]
MDSDSAELSEGELVSPAGWDQAQRKILIKSVDTWISSMVLDHVSQEKPAALMNILSLSVKSDGYETKDDVIG